MTDTIEEIRARHEADAGLEEEDYVMSPDLTVQAHADRATLLQALAEAQERAERAEGKLGRTAEALGWFIEDARFRVAVGGNPNVVESMLAEAREVYHEARAAQTLKERNDV